MFDDFLSDILAVVFAADLSCTFERLCFTSVTNPSGGIPHCRFVHLIKSQSWLAHSMDRCLHLNVECYLLISVFSFNTVYCCLLIYCWNDIKPTEDVFIFLLSPAGVCSHLWVCENVCFPMVISGVCLHFWMFISWFLWIYVCSHQWWCVVFTSLGWWLFFTSHICLNCGYFCTHISLGLQVFLYLTFVWVGRCFTLFVWAGGYFHISHFFGLVGIFKSHICVPDPMMWKKLNLPTQSA